MFAKPGIIIAIYVFINPIDFKSKNNGSIVTWLGIIIELNNRLNKNFFPLNLYLAKAYPAIEVKVIYSKVTIDESSKLLKKFLHTFNLSKRI